MKLNLFGYPFLSAALLLISGERVRAAAGATVPFTTYEAEAGTVSGGATVVSLTASPTDSPALAGVEITASSKGDAKFDHNTVTGLNSGQPAFVNKSANFTTVPPDPSTN